MTFSLILIGFIISYNSSHISIILNEDQYLFISLLVIGILLLILGMNFFLLLHNFKIPELKFDTIIE
ncbi:unnamed protein product [marine sediment metagenome]|uniref:Uncharacterized protein n=1 Tax=marine sediment metagenome TaxID=412755 RepID=X0ZV60_9ZZZZ